jgi:hypothetical protein
MKSGLFIYQIWFVFLLTIVTGLMFSEHACADEGWTLDIRKRQEERKKEKWYFAEHLGAKKESQRLDLLYRFFLGQRQPQARVELVGYGVGVALLQTQTLAESSSEQRVTGAGYGGRLAFNHFIAALTGWRTPNIVPTVFGETVETAARSSSEAGRMQTFGAGVRLFGQNPEDTALYADYARRRFTLIHEKSILDSEVQLLDPGTYESWVVDLTAQLYLLPSLALVGGWVLPESVVMGHEASPRYRLREFRGGVQLDIFFMRLGYEYLERSFDPKGTEAEVRVRQIQHLLRLGFLF